MQAETWEFLSTELDLCYLARGKQFNTLVADQFWRMLKHLDDHLVKAATLRLISLKLSWPPVPQEIHVECLEMVSPVPSEGLAWADVTRRFGKVHAPPPLHPLVDLVASLFGGLSTLWHQVTAGEKLSVLRAQYIDEYRRQMVVWREAVARELYKPPSERNPAYFPVPVGHQFALAPIVSDPARALPAFRVVESLPERTFSPPPPEAIAILRRAGLGTRHKCSAPETPETPAPVLRGLK